jgi:translation initiation factor IF-2
VQAPVASIALDGPIVVGELANRLNVNPAELIGKLLGLGIMAGINQQLTLEQARRAVEAMGIEVEEAEAEGSEEALVDRAAVGRLLEADRRERMAERPPVVVVMGHVDHGKTTLLDAIRETRVAEGEAGGITQHIGASTVEYGGRKIVFLDTPGHEAFTAMRARGAEVTDIAILVVAADDGIMPQTVEAISHARAANVPIIVAVNKIDKPNANPDRVLQQLAEQGLVPEEWGGDTIVVPVSALRREGIDRLMEMVLLVADLQELKGDPERRAVGTVIEARIARGRGPVATVLVQSGTLRPGDPFVAGAVAGRVRALNDDRGKPVSEAGPSTPVEVLGFDELPEAGDVFEVTVDDRTAREAAMARMAEKKRDLSATRAVTLAEWSKAGGEGAARGELNIVLKADVMGSLEALRASLEKVRNEEARVVVLHGGVGPINGSDVMLAAASKAVIVGFNVRPDAAAEREAERAGVEIKTYRVIYDLIGDLEKAITGMLAPKFEDVVVGRAEVRATFRVPGAGTVAGCYVQDGVVRRGLMARLVRGGTIVHEGPIASLRRFKDDVREVAAGYECGVGLERFHDIKEGDVLEIVEHREVRP